MMDFDDEDDFNNEDEVPEEVSVSDISSISGGGSGSRRSSSSIEYPLKAFGLHRQNKEPTILTDKDGNFVASSMPILLTNGGDDANLHCYIARYSPKKHYCCIPSCPKPEIGAGTSLKFVYKVKICNN